MQIILDDKYRQQLSTLLKLAGFRWGKRGNPTTALVAIATGTHKLIPTTGNQAGVEWIEPVMETIAAEIPLAIEYQSPSGKTETFIAEFLEIVWHERQYYLNIWTQSRSSDPDLPRNRCLRFDRIGSIEPKPQVQWRSALDTIVVEFNLHNGLAASYEPKPGDIASDRLDNKLVVRRHINNTFWFIREIIVYGGDCEVIYPPSVRSLAIERLKSALDRYQIECRS
ncbi:helix-turn-helix transcriptional regulator [Chamaesiphon sp.]|uniref:helix-turn-helix transcriptional regulator n=1 Tax=Chamaesiphon sp. TaxID=2814140 RepID=UPI0035944985